ncbi:MAG: hypothetical protein CMJ59_20840 [Planctomycetaceae bacterium]|nr:hypothetical protein [Planctomycetaceae bacterium]
MGQMRFLVPHKEQLPQDALDWAFLDGIDAVPWPCRFHWEGDELVVDRAVDESGSFHLPWHVTDEGPVTLQTASLIQREARYSLPVELARGTVNRLRNFAAEWRLADYTLSSEITEHLNQATAHFIRAATQQSDISQSTREASQAIQRGTQGIQQLTQQFAQQSLSARLQKNARLPTMLAGTLPLDGLPAPIEKVFAGTFNSAAISINWRLLEPNPGEFQWDALDRQIEWCQRSGLRVCAGPLVQLDRQHLPDWIYLWEDSYSELQSNALRMVDQVVRRYRGRVQIWHCAARLNLDDDLSLDEQQRLMLAVAILRTIHTSDTSSPLVISFDRPWGEYLTHKQIDLSPLHFADELVRAEIGLKGLGLEINLGFSPGGTPFRDLLEINRQIDRWAALGLPLLISLTIPGNTDSAGSPPGSASDPDQHAIHWQPSLEFQRQTIQQMFPLFLAKTSIHGVIWKQLVDQPDSETRYGGLFHQDFQSKPALAALQTIRSEYLR